MSAPTTTLLIPCYNAARFLPRLMGYISEMSVPFARILCYDDGSTDDTVNVARSLGLEIITPNPNKGVSHARNRLADSASTEWIHFHDADDRIHPDFLKRLAPLAEDSTDVVSCDADWVSESNGALVISWRYDNRALAQDPTTHLLRNPLGLNSSIIRRSKWYGVGGCDESLAMWEDADVHFRLALAGAKWRHLPEVLTWSLRNEASFSHDYVRNWNCRLQALEKYAMLPTASHLQSLTALEVERASAELLRLGDRNGAMRGLALCRRLGHRVPETRNPGLALLRHFLPAGWLLALQNRCRRK